VTAFNGSLMAADMRAMRKNVLDLVSRTQHQVKATTVYAFFAGRRQTRRTAELLAAALGRPLDRYVQSEAR
jgi:hypothetical protein